MSTELALASQALMLLAFGGCAVELAVLCLGVRRWRVFLGGPHRSPIFAGGDDVPVCFVVVDVEPTHQAVSGALEELLAEHGHGSRPFETRFVLSGEASQATELIEQLGAVGLPHSTAGRPTSVESFAFGVEGRTQIVFQGQASFGELMQWLARTSSVPYFAVTPLSATPGKCDLAAMTRILAERSDDPVVLGSPGALALHCASGPSSWRRLREGTSRRSALLAWSGPGSAGMSAFWTAPVLASRERLIDPGLAPTFDRGEWLERLSAAARGVALAVTLSSAEDHGAPFWIAGDRGSTGRTVWSLLSGLAVVRGLLLLMLASMAAVGDVHVGWLLLAAFAAVVLPSSVRLLGQLALESGVPAPDRLVRLAYGSICLAPFAGGLARRGWI